jgi:hypothetical protein
MPSKVYPRPMGGPEPSAQGASDNIPMSSHSTQPEGGIYDYRSSMPGRSMSDLGMNSEGVMGKITSAKSDPPEQCKASPKPRT